MAKRPSAGFTLRAWATKALKIFICPAIQRISTHLFLWTGTTIDDCDGIL